MSASRDIFDLRPGAVGPVKKMGDRAEAGRPESQAMLNVAQRDVQINERQDPAATRGRGLAPAFEKVAYWGVTQMTPAQWAAVPDNPRQRNTESRAAKADHLKVPHASHVKVNMALLPDGRRIKLDGHTRSYLWENGSVQAPPTVYADVWTCPDIGAVKHLYETFDSRAAVETTTDQVFGAGRELQLEYKSELLRSHRFVAGLRLASEIMHGQVSARAASVYELMRYWSRELDMLDGCAPSRSCFNAGLIAGALITFRRYGERAAAFWSAFARNAGIKGPDGMDAVQALTERVARLKKDGATSSRSDAEYIASISLTAFDGYRAGRRYALENGAVRALKESTLRDWVNAAKMAKRG